MKNLIGRKVRGFKFEEFKHAEFDEIMNSFIGKDGIIESYNKNTNCFLIRFDVDNFRQWSYPADQIEAHLVDEEIPTLSDGVMMLVSNDGRDWLEREVIGKKNEIFYAWNGYVIFNWKYAKPIEPTKEEQLTAILGSSEKVNQIMELFKNT